MAKLSTLGIMSLISLTIIPLLLLICWIVVEFRCRTWVRVVIGFAALVTVAAMAFLWGSFAEAFKHAEFPAPHDSPGDTTIMDAADKAATNFQSHTVDNAADRRRWLREIDEENAKHGFVKDTNGELIYVGITNVPVSSNQESVK